VERITGMQDCGLGTENVRKMKIAWMVLKMTSFHY